jgi:hypothetical protein
MKTISRRLHKLELRGIEETPQAPGDAKRKLLERINAVRARLDAARERGEYVPDTDPEQAKAMWDARIAELRTGAR